MFWKYSGINSLTVGFANESPNLHTYYWKIDTGYQKIKKIEWCSWINRGLQDSSNKTKMDNLHKQTKKPYRGFFHINNTIFIHLHDVTTKYYIIKLWRHSYWQAPDGQVVELDRENMIRFPWFSLEIMPIWIRKYD